MPTVPDLMVPVLWPFWSLILYKHRNTVVFHYESSALSDIQMKRYVQNGFWAAVMWSVAWQSPVSVPTGWNGWLDWAPLLPERNTKTFPWSPDSVVLFVWWHTFAVIQCWRICKKNPLIWGYIFFLCMANRKLFISSSPRSGHWLLWNCSPAGWKWVFFLKDALLAFNLDLFFYYNNPLKSLKKPESN